MMTKLYMNIKLPKEIIEEIDRIINLGILGYRSRAEFIAEATRTHIMKLEELIKTRTINKNLSS